MSVSGHLKKKEKKKSKIAGIFSGEAFYTISRILALPTHFLRGSTQSSHTGVTVTTAEVKTGNDKYTSQSMGWVKRRTEFPVSKRTPTMKWQKKTQHSIVLPAGTAKHGFKKTKNVCQSIWKIYIFFKWTMNQLNYQGKPIPFCVGLQTGG